VPNNVVSHNKMALSDHFIPGCWTQNLWFLPRQLFLLSFDYNNQA
jgi:hypothetical protein